MARGIDWFPRHEVTSDDLFVQLCQLSGEMVVRGPSVGGAFVVSTFVASLVPCQMDLPVSQISSSDWRCLVLLWETGDTVSTVLSLLPVQ